MNASIQSRLPELQRRWRRLGMRQRDVFGSPVRAHFDPAVNCMATLESMPPSRYAELSAFHHDATLHGSMSHHVSGTGFVSH